MTRNENGRRSFFRTSAMAAMGTALASAASAAEKADSKSSPSLRDKFYGCVVGVHVGSALGAGVELMRDWRKIEERYGGPLQKLVAYEHYGNGWMREPGTTEDGVERQKLMITALIEKQDRINAEDLKAIWVRDMRPDAPGMISEGFEGTLLAMAKAKLPAVDIGKYCDYAGLISMARSCQPIALMNAGDIKAAMNDVYEVGQLYQSPRSYGLNWAAVTAVMVATATKPGATVDSCIGAVYDNCHKNDVVRELDKGLKLTQNAADWKEVRSLMDTIYSGEGIRYAYSYANEIVTRALCIFRVTKANTFESMVAGANNGRDADCIPATAAGYSGALTGPSGVPEEMIRQVDYATTLMKVTNNRRTLRESADGLYEAYKARLKKMKTYVDEMETV